MIDEQFRIHAEQPIKQFLVLQRHPGNLSHRVDSVDSQFLSDTMADTPETRQWPMAPKLTAVGHLVQLRYADTVLVGRFFLSHDIHGHLAEIHVCSDASSSGDTSLTQHVTYHGHSQFVCGHFVGLQIVRHVHKHLVDTIHMDVLRSDVF